jgi:hypothetical protein
MRRVNRMLVIGIALVCAGVFLLLCLVFIGANFLSVYFAIPDGLQVSRSVSPLGQKTKNPLSPFKTINDTAVVQKLYKAILALPPYPLMGVTGSCVRDPQLVLYDLTFFKNGKLIRHGTIDILAGCGAGETVHLDGTYEREFYDQNQISFVQLLESSFGVTADQIFHTNDPYFRPLLFHRSIP